MNKNLIMIFALIITLLIVSFGKASAAETIAKDTVLYNGTYELIKQEKQNKAGEIRLNYFVILHDFSKRKVRTDKKSYELWLNAGDDELENMIINLVYNRKSDGSRILTKVFLTTKEL